MGRKKQEHKNHAAGGEDEVVVGRPSQEPAEDRNRGMCSTWKAFCVSQCVMFSWALRCHVPAFSGPGSGEKWSCQLLGWDLLGCGGDGTLGFGPWGG